tara:strand:+ start:348 stop:941 length:594 start_codon:yes stop_codon:yes gene_type:complete
MAPMMGLGASLSTAVSERTAVVIEDYMFDSSTAGELTPEVSPSDFHDTWDLDGTDFTPEALPDDEGYWDIMPELVTNGGFDADSGWSHTRGSWAISGGTLNTTSETDYCHQDISDQSNITMEVIFTVTAVSAGSVQFRIFGDSSTTLGTARSTVGTFTEFIQFPSDHNGSIGFQGSSFTGSIDNLSITEFAIRPLDV